MGLDGTKLGNYELLAEIAEGSTADVLLARVRGMAGFERHVVIKRVRDERAGDNAFAEAFINEARLAAALHHHNIVQVQDIAEADGLPYFAMEYVHGEDLRVLLAHVHARRESIPVAHIVTIGLAVAAALHHAHEHGIVHRDVTPANILIGYDGNVKVLDFGMAKAATTPGTQVGVKKGKAPYMAPEQCAGERIDRRCDVFALGIVLYELVTARRLFKGTSDHDTMSMILHGSIPSPRDHRPELAAELSAIIMKALERLPSDRFQSAAALAQALETYSGVSGLVGSSSALGTYLRQQLGDRKEPWLAGGSVRPSTPVDFDGAVPGIAVPAGEEPEQTAVLAPVPPAFDDEMAEETATTEIPAAQLAAMMEDLAPRPAMASMIDLPPGPAPNARPEPAAGPKAAATAEPTARPRPAAAKPIPSVTGKSSGKLEPGAFTPKVAGSPAVAAPATAAAVAAPATAAAAAAAGPGAAASPAVATPGKPLPAPPIVPKPEVAAAASAEKPNWDALSTNVPRLPPPPRVAPRISTPAAMPKLEAAAAALDGDLTGAATDPRYDSAARRARRGSTAPIASDTSGQARGEIIIEARPHRAESPRPAADMTELVTPLPPAEVGRRARSRRTVLVAAIGGAAVFVVIVVAIAFTGGSSGASSTSARSVVKPSLPAPSAAAAPAAAPSAGEMTWNGVLDAGAAARPAVATGDAAEASPPEVAAPGGAAPEAAARGTDAEAPASAAAPDERASTTATPKAIAAGPGKPAITTRPALASKAAPVGKLTSRHPARPAKPAKTGAPLKYAPNTLFLRK